MNILVSKINFLGDAVSFLPTLQGIASYFPKAEITVICTSAGQEIFAGSVQRLRFFNVDYQEVRSFKALFKLCESIPSLRKRQFVFSFHSYDEPSFSYLASALAGIPMRIGFASGVAKAQRLLTDSIPFDASRNVVDINYDLVRYVTQQKDLHPNRLPIWYSPHDQKIVFERLSQAGLNEGNPFIAIHPGAKLPYQRWSYKKYFELAERLNKKVSIPILFLGEVNYLDSSFRTITQINIKQLACLLEKASLFIGNNSGPMNLAAAMGTPSVVIQGPTAPNWEIFWHNVPKRILKATNFACLPCNGIASKNGICVNKESPLGCMKAISVDMVEEAVVEMLSRIERNLRFSC